MNVNVTQQASQAVVTATGLGGGTTALSGSSLLVTGNKGAELFNFQFDTAFSAIAAAVNSTTENTGVTASATAGGVSFLSEFHGENEFVSVKDISSPLIASQFISAYDDGRDVEGTINGSAAATRGNTLTVNTFELDIDISLSASFFANNAAGGSAATVRLLP